MVPFRIHGIAAIGKFRPDTVGQVFVVGGIRPVVEAGARVVVVAQHFLQEYQIGRGGAYRVAQLRQDEAPVQPAEALVGIDGQHLDRVNRGCLVGEVVLGGTRRGHKKRSGSWPGWTSSPSARSSFSSNRRAS